MNTTESEGLGFSALVYLGAILGALALLAVPAYYATRAEVHANPPLAQSDPLLKGTIISDGSSARFPLASLQRQSLADAETTAFLKPRKKADPAPRIAAGAPGWRHTSGRVADRARPAEPVSL